MKKVELLNFMIYKVKEFCKGKLSDKFFRGSQF
jgi:hypothetical protein